MKAKLLILGILIFMLADFAAAATVHGSVYDLYLEKQSNSVISVDTVPKQTYVSKNGSYSFELEPGSYELKAEYYEFNELISSAEENITIAKEGDYVVDLILFPYFGEEEEIFNESNLELDEIVEEKTLWDRIIYGGFIALLIKALIILISGMFLVLLASRIYKKIKKEDEKIEMDEEKNLEKQILDFIKAKGITTQKEIRKNFFSSEAKVSLILTDLEKQGKIEKIEKGRGNIIKMLGNH